MLHQTTWAVMPSQCNVPPAAFCVVTVIVLLFVTRAPRNENCGQSAAKNPEGSAQPVT